MFDLSLLAIQPNPSQKECKGLIYKAKHNDYIHQGKIVYKMEMVPMKRLSCKGCPDCESLLEMLQLDYDNGVMPDTDQVSTKNGQFYTLAISGGVDHSYWGDQEYYYEIYFQPLRSK